MAKRGIVHVEIPTTNVEKSADFYKNLFDWDIQQVPDPTPYTMFHASNAGGGFVEVGDHTRVGDVLIYIETDEIEADLKRIETLGGKTVTPKMAVGEFGAMAVFTDPTGNRIALWQSNPPG